MTCNGLVSTNGAQPSGGKILSIMFGTLGGPELVLILVVALIVFGPRKLPEIGKSMGKMMVEFRRASTEFKRTLEVEVETEKISSPKPPKAVEPSPEAEPAPRSSAVPGVGATAEEASQPPVETAASTSPEGSVPRGSEEPPRDTPS